MFGKVLDHRMKQTGDEEYGEVTHIAVTAHKHQHITPAPAEFTRQQDVPVSIEANREADRGKTSSQALPHHDLLR
jgi:hypothetical protein